MMRRYGLAFLSMVIAAMLVPTRSSTAQTAEPAAWPPDPKKIFTENVRVISEQRFNEPAPYTLVQQGERWYLREDATGKLSSALPENITRSGSVTTTPDPDWLLIWTDVQDVNGEHLVYPLSAVYSHNFKTDTTYPIGLIPGYAIHFQWLTDHDLFVESRDGSEWAVAYAYVANTKQGQGFHEVLQSVRFPFQIVHEPPQIIKWETPDNRENWTPDCTRTVYDVRSGSVKSDDYDTFCIPEYLAPNGRGYYVLELNPATFNFGHLGLLRYDPLTSKITALIAGEFGSVIWVSADETRAIVSDPPRAEFSPADHTSAYTKLFLEYACDSGPYKLLQLKKPDYYAPVPLHALPTGYELHNGLLLVCREDHIRQGLTEQIYSLFNSEIGQEIELMKIDSRYRTRLEKVINDRITFAIQLEGVSEQRATIRYIIEPIGN